MNDIKELFDALLKTNNVTVAPEHKKFLDAFLKSKENNNVMAEIVQKTNKLMDKWKVEQRIRNIMEHSLRIPNATVGKEYDVSFEPDTIGLSDVKDFQWEGLEEVGLMYDADVKKIRGNPNRSGDIPLVFHFRVAGQGDDAKLSAKPVTLIVNPDPKSLWKNIESDKEDRFWKDDNVTVFGPLGDRHIVVSSKRGRSHANTGGFREDDFAFGNLQDGWSIVAVADGAGSAKLSRQGSAIACAAVLEHFSDSTSVNNMKECDALVKEYESAKSEEVQKKLNRFVYNNLGKAAFKAHKRLERFASENQVALKDLASTLVFALFKKYDEGYVILSFGVGDCPAAVLNKDITEATLMNWIDVGEYGGGTRFITMPEIFQNEKFATRFGFKFIRDFSYIILMSDGIYDPKFVVESALPDIKKWHTFLEDMGGKNPDGIKVDLDAGNAKIKEQMSAWMDFWSPGNHDDRTLAIVF